MGMFDYINTYILFGRRVSDEKPTLESVIAKNIEATRSLVDTITEYDATVTRLGEKQQQCQDDERFKRRASDRR
jgi:hypothetical protein